MQNLPDTPEERHQRRRTRRWKRRARIVGPFLAVPLLLVTLSLSVDLVEYQPHEEPDRLTDRPIRITPQPATRPTMRPSLKPTTAISAPTPDVSENLGDAEGIRADDEANLDVTLPADSLLQPTPTPTPPYALGRH